MFPDAEIPEDGLVVECTACGHHIGLDSFAADGDDKTNVQFEQQPADDPRAVLSARIRLDDADWSEMDDSRIMPALGSGQPGSRPRPEGVGSRNPDHQPSPVSEALISLQGAVGFNDPPSSSSHTPSPSADSAEVSARLSGPYFSWRDLLQALATPFDIRRFFAVLGSVWACLIIHSFFSWLSLKVTLKSGALGGTLALVTWSISVVSGCLICAFCAHQTYRQCVEKQSTSIRSSIDWVRGWLSSILGAPVVAVGVIALIVVLESLIGFMGRIPYAGPAIWGILSLAVVLISIGGGLALVAMAYGLLLYIPLIIAERTGPMDTLKRILSLFKHHSSQIILLGTTSVIGIGVFLALTLAPALIIGREFTNRIAQISMGGAFQMTIDQTPSPLAAMSRLFFRAGYSDVPAGPNVGHDIGGFFAGMASLVAPSVSLTFLALMTTCAGGLIYAIVVGRSKG